MIIKQIELNNIRSYEKEVIDFREGSTLLAGDIGSGKTSVLLAIEFGLFGLQPGQRGSALLRNGSGEGGVKLIFQVDENEVVVERTLKKGKTISQDYAAISINGEKEELAVTELKQKILSLLKYPDEFAKKNNILYKFTVYTPQEEMKQIILEDSETRLNTLRHVFGIDKYKTILENVSVLRLKLREEKRLYEGITSNFDEDKSILDKKIEKLGAMEKETFALSENVLIKIENRKNKEKEKEEIEDKLKERNLLKEEIGKSKILVMSKEETYSSNDRLILSLKKEIEDFKLLNFEEKKIFEIENEIILLKRERDKTSEEIMEINSNLTSLKLKKEEAKKIQDKMSNLEVCPTCYQNVDAIYRANVLNKAHNDLSSSETTLNELDFQKKNSFEKVEKLNLKISEKEKEFTDLKILKMKLEGVKEKEKKLDELKKGNENLDKDIVFLRKHISDLNDSIFKFSSYEKIYEEKESELKLAFREEKMAEIKLAELRKEIEVSKNSISELEERIKKIQEIQKKLEYISELELWLSKKFVPVVSFIERNVMISLRYEFSKLFSEWFNALVPENFAVRLSEDFSPIIEQKDYEIDYAYLSGGERTAIALAYRLSLNQVINSLMSKIKTKDLVILDEPTDGFSEQQLDKMRNVLEQLNVRQLIIVSHEQKIEGFVENVIKFKKDYGVSRRE